MLKIMWPLFGNPAESPVRKARTLPPALGKARSFPTFLACLVDVVHTRCVSVGSKRGSGRAFFLPERGGKRQQCGQRTALVRGPARRYGRSVSFLGSLVSS